MRVARRGGLELHELHPAGRFVATLQPGVRGAEPFTDRGRDHPPSTSTPRPTPSDDGPVADARVVEVLPPDVRTMDLTEAATIVGGGAGLDSEERFAELDSFAERIGGVMGATRVITDRGWVHHDRQIGTTGVVVDPDAVPVVRRQRCRAAHQRARHARPHHQRQHRPALPDDGDVRPRHRQ